MCKTKFTALGGCVCVCVCVCKRERSHSIRTALLNTIRGFSLMGLFSLCCQPACGALCLWGSNGRQVFRVDLVSSQSIWEAGAGARPAPDQD